MLVTEDDHGAVSEPQEDRRSLEVSPEAAGATSMISPFRGNRSLNVAAISIVMHSSR